MDFTRMLHKFTVVPSLTEELAALQRIAYNLWWCWEPEAINLFRRLDADLWQTTRHNPLEMRAFSSRRPWSRSSPTTASWPTSRWSMKGFPNT